MTIRIEAISLTVVCTEGTATYATRLNPGLNVLNAPNSWGKSTLLQAIVYGLGLEGSQSASRRSPLGPAMTTVVETSRGRSAVGESYVTVTISNNEGRYLRVRRWGLSNDVGRDLVHVWVAASEAELDDAPRLDMFVREPGSTTSEVGFHRLLEQFIGWDLPSVPLFSGRESRLYLEVLFPLFYVEQKFGWSGIAPRVPTHYGIREPLKRAVEFTLGLNTLALMRAREALRDEDAAITREWAAAAERARGAAAAENFRLVLLTESPLGTAQRRPTLIEASDGNQWISLDAAQDAWRRRLSTLQEVGITAGQRTAQSRSELLDAEREVQRLGAAVRNLHEQLAMSRGDQDAIAARLASLESDRRRLQDVKRIERLGGELELPLLAEGRCPTCSQSVDDRDVATDTVSTVEDNIALLDAERATLISMQAAAEGRSTDIARSIASAEAALSEARDRVRLLRDELVGPSNAPSLSVVQERLAIENRLRSAARVSALVGAVDEALDDLAGRVDDVRARRASLQLDSDNPEDQATLRRFRTSFQQQLVAYNLRSLSPRDVTIDDKTLLPVNDGFELTFDVGMGMSASDTIRTKWAYHTALMETATSVPSGRHLGILILDEPRQQETDRRSLSAFLQRLNHDSGLAQVVYATSEDAAVLNKLLEGIPHTRLSAEGSHLIDFRP